MNTYQAPRSAFADPLRFCAVLWSYRSLLWQFTVRNVEIRHKGSYLGLLWSVLNPLFMLALYVFVFGHILGGKFGVLPNETKVDFALAVFFGLAIFHFVAEVLGVSPGLIVLNPNFVKRVVFPLEVLPAATVGAAAFHLLISLGLVLISVQLLGAGLDFGALWLPVILLPLVVLTLGIAWFFSAVGVFLRDIGQVMQFLTMALMFSSAIFYSTQNLGKAWVWMRLNPILLAIELSRDAALWHRPINLTHLGYLYAVGFFSCFVGYIAFRKMKSAFADVL